MSKKDKPIRIFTDRSSNNPRDHEAIELELFNDRHYLYWVQDGGRCPVCVEWVQERFKQAGRTYNSSGKEFAKTYSDLMHVQAT